MGRSWWLPLAMVLVAHCDRTPKQNTQEGVLSLLHAALSARQPLNNLVDARLVSEASVLVRAKNVEMAHGIPFREAALQVQLEDEAPRMDPQRRFGDALGLLRDGRCTKLRDARLPSLLQHAPEAGERWPRAATELTASVARRLVGATAADFRCGDGPEFRAIFVRASATDDALRVVYLGPGVEF